MSNHNDFKRTALSFAIGAAAGSAFALLFAPMRGDELRGRISDEARVRKDAAAERLQELQENTNVKVGELSSRARETARELGERAAEKMSRARQATEETISRTRDGAFGQSEALTSALRAGVEAYEQALNGVRRRL